MMRGVTPFDEVESFGQGWRIGNSGQSDEEGFGRRHAVSRFQLSRIDLGELCQGWSFGFNSSDSGYL